MYVGYRWYDKKIEPRFPFGYGLSYTSFELRNLKIMLGTGDAAFTATVDVTNTGHRDGAAVAQLYVRPPADEPVDRPVQELKGFAKVQLAAGETKSVTILLDERSFAHWDVETHSWKVIPGNYQIAVGQSSRGEMVTAVVSCE